LEGGQALRHGLIAVHSIDLVITALMWDKQRNDMSFLPPNQSKKAPKRDIDENSHLLQSLPLQ
jgi:hypothetical protein